jgi:hypothetical protein
MPGRTDTGKSEGHQRATTGRSYRGTSWHAPRPQTPGKRRHERCIVGSSHGELGAAALRNGACRRRVDRCLRRRCLDVRRRCIVRPEPERRHEQQLLERRLSRGGFVRRVFCGGSSGSGASHGGSSSGGSSGRGSSSSGSSTGSSSSSGSSGATSSGSGSTSGGVPFICCNANGDPCCTYLYCDASLTPACSAELACQADGGTWNGYTDVDGSVIPLPGCTFPQDAAPGDAESDAPSSDAAAGDGPE